ncbi:MAG: hypothetical protein ACHQYP_02840 [Nitrospiria bacterium]
MTEIKFSTMALISLLLFESCSGGGGGSFSSISISSIQIAPAPLIVQLGKSTQITVTAKDGTGHFISNPDLTWTVIGGGTITAQGLYTPPSMIPPQNSVTIQVASSINSAIYATAPVLILTGDNISFPSPVDITGTIQPLGNAPNIQMAIFNQRVYLTWATTWQEGGTHIWYAKLDLDGNVLTPPHDILSDVIPSGGTQNFIFENPVIALDNRIDSNGDPGVYIAWDDNTGSDFQVGIVKGPSSNNCLLNVYPCFSAFSILGPPTFATSLYVEPNPTVFQTYPSISFNPQGGIDFAWVQSYSVLLSGLYINFKELKLDGTAQSLSSPISQYYVSNYQKNPTIRTDNSGNVSVSWLDFGTSNFLLNYSRGFAGYFSAAIQVEPDALAYHDTSSMVLDDSGLPYFVWSNSSSSNTGINYSSSTDFLNFAGYAPISSTGLNPSIEIDLLKYLYVKWEDENSGTIYFDKFQSGSPQVPVSFVGLNSSMSIDSVGRVYLLFSRFDGSSYSTYFLRGE